MMVQLDGQTDSLEPRIDRQECPGGRLPLLHFSWRTRLFVLVVGFVLCSHSEAFAHIPTRSPYRKGVSEADWAAFSNAVFFLSQLLGWVYLTVVLQAERRQQLWKNFGLAFLFQAAVAVVLLFSGMISFLIGGAFTRESHIVASGYEIFSVIRPPLVTNLLVANTVTFAISWGISFLLLLTVRGMHRRWLVALFHTFVFHPFAFPVGILFGLIHALYVRQTVPEEQSG